MRKQICRIVMSITLVGLVLLLRPLSIKADAPFDDLTPNEYSFVGRRGATYTATWDPSTYEITIATPDGTFPWDWTAFVNSNGAMALAGHPDVVDTFQFSDSNSLLGLGTGDVMRVKAWDIISLAHLTKIGLVIGSGPSAQRAYLSEGVISHYTLAPHYIGYEVSVLGRTVTVRLSHVAPDTLEAVGIIEVQLDDPTNAYLLVASDLEPRTRYQQAVEYRGIGDTLLSFLSDEQAIRGRGGDGTEVFFYTASPLSSWSAHNRSFDDVLDADTLDESVVSGQSDGRAALKVVAQPVQHFYIGNVVLDSDERDDPSLLTNALRDARLSALNQLPTLDADDLPAFKFVLALSNLFGTYLINPEGRIYYTDKAFPYTADGIAPLTEIPALLPDAWLDAYHDYLDYIADIRYSSPSAGVYWWRADADGNPSLPSWYGHNIPDIFYRNRNNVITQRFQYSDLYSTALYIIALDDYYLTTADDAFIQTQEYAIRDAVSALQIFDTAYGNDGDLFPHLLVPMGDLIQIEGVYPTESAYTIYAYERAAHLYRVLDDDSSADDLLDNYVAPMRADYDATFWSGDSSFFLPRRDDRSRTGSGDYFDDFWTQSMLPPLRGDIGDNRLPDLLNTFTRTEFYDADLNYRWLSTDSENYRSDSWFVTGYTMEGGFFNGVPNVIPAVASYQLGENTQADQYANSFYFDVWTRMGPYETMRGWDTTPVGMYLETSIYIEPLVGTWWLFEESLGLSVDGITVTVEPRLGGEFVARNVRVTADGLSAVFNYARDDGGREHIQVLSNEGLVVVVPNAVLPHHFAFSDVASPPTAGQPFQVTITAQDEQNNTVTDYIVPAILTDTTGTISPTITSNFAAGVWIGDVAITQAQSGITLAAQQCNVTGVSNSFVVEPDVPHHFAFTEIGSPQTAGQTFQVTIIALDVYGNTATNYVGSATLADSTGTLSPLTTGSFTDGVWTGDVAITQVQSDVTLTVADGGITGESNDFDVQPGSLHHFVFVEVGSPQTAGQSFPVTITAQDAYDNVITTYTGPAALSDSTGTVSPLTTGGFVDGVWTDDVTITQAQIGVTITVQDNGAIGESDSFDVQPGPLHHFAFAEIGSLQTAGQPFQITITAQDAYANTVAGHVGSVTLTDTTGTISPTVTASFSAGVWTGAVIITQTQDDITITAQDGSITGISDSFDIQSESLDHFVLAEVGTPQTAGQPFTIIITAQDRHDNTVTTYTGPAMLTDTTGTISPTIMAGFTNGVWIGDVTITQVQTEVMLTTYDGSSTGESDSFDVHPGALDHFTFAQVNSPQTAGQSFQVTITAQDAYSNTVTDYAGSAVLTDTTGTISPTITGSFTSGIWAGDLTITQAQSDVTVTTQDGSATGDSDEFDVGAGTLHHFAFAAINSLQTAGQLFQVTVTAQDAYSNTVTDYAGSATLTDTTGTITPPVTGGFTDGIWSGDVMILLAQDGVTITVQDGTAVGESGEFDVEPRVVHHFVFAAISSPQTAGESFQVTIVARDEYSNTATAYTGSATLADTTGTISPTITGSFTDGIWTGDMTVTRAQESVTITVRDNGPVGESDDFDVQPGTLHHFVFDGLGSLQTVGQPFPVTITARDVHSNTVTGYTGSATLADTTGTISPTITGSFTDGIWTGDVTVTRAQESVTITIRDNGPVGESDDFDVQPGTLHHFVFDGLGSLQTAGQPFQVTITAQDVYGNTVVDYAGSATLTDTTGTISPTVTSSFTGGIWSGDVTISQAQEDVTVAVQDGSTVGESNDFDVKPGTLHHFVFDGLGSLQTAGQPFQVTITAQDVSGNTVIDYAGSATLTDTTGTISPTVTSSFTGGVWSGDVTITQAQKDVTIMAQDGSTLGNSDDFAVVATGIDHVTILPVHAAIIAGDAHTYTTKAFDRYHNSLGDVTTATTFVLSPFASGECDDNVCAPQIVGTWTVTATCASKVATATMAVVHASLDDLRLTPDVATRVAGDSISYTLTAYDAYDNAWDLTSSGIYAVDFRAGGLWMGNAYTTEIAGTWIITGTYGGPSLRNVHSDGTKYATATLTVNAGAFHHIAVCTDSGGQNPVVDHVMTTDDEFTLYAAGYDAADNFIANQPVTWKSVGTLDSVGGSGTSYTFSPTMANTSGVIVADAGDGITDTTGTITVNPGALHTILIRDAAGGGGNEVFDHTMAVGDEFTVYAAGYDADENYVSDVSASWSTTGSLDPVPAGPTASVIFAPATSGTAGTIVANDGSGHDGATGIVTVIAPEGETYLLFLPHVTRAAR
ncbi:MAG: hypothetical protein GY832_08955 [Chloroflexi bacterium]|nr:hypothetical protein [Chloroflexota bacterium]